MNWRWVGWIEGIKCTRLFYWKQYQQSLLSAQCKPAEYFRLHRIENSCFYHTWQIIEAWTHVHSSRLGPVLLTWIKFNPSMDKCPVKCVMKSVIHQQTSTVASFKFRNGYVTRVPRHVFALWYSLSCLMDTTYSGSWTNVKRCVFVCDCLVIKSKSIDLRVWTSAHRANGSTNWTWPNGESVVHSIDSNATQLEYLYLDPTDSLLKSSDGSLALFPWCGARE